MITKNNVENLEHLNNNIENIGKQRNILKLCKILKSEEQRSQLNEASEDKPNETQPSDASEGVHENITATTHKKILIPVTYSDENEYAGWQAT